MNGIWLQAFLLKSLMDFYTLASNDFQLAYCSYFEVYTMEDEATLSAEFEGFDYSDGYGCWSFWKGDVREGIW